MDDHSAQIMHELESLRQQMAELQRENKSLKLEKEIMVLESQLLDHSDQQFTSTPKPGASTGANRILPDIDLPPRRLVDDRSADQRLADSIPTYGQTDRFVTQRRTKAKPSATMTATMKPATFDGSVAWMDYKAHFEACAELNGWTKEQKGLYLSVSLRGQAQAVFGNLEQGNNDNDKLVRALEERFAPPNQTELYRVQLRKRRQKASETMAELGQDIRRLTNLAYPKAPTDVRETLAKEQFVDALVSSEMRLKIKQARPADLNDAVRHAVELEAFYRAEQKHLGQGMIQTTVSAETKDDSGWKEAFSSLNKSMEEMAKNMITMLAQQQQKLKTFAERPYDQHRNQSIWSGTDRRDSRQKRKCFIFGNNFKTYINSFSHFD